MTAATATPLTGEDLVVAAPKRAIGPRVWAATWPKLVAVALFILAWQIVVWTGWKPEYIIPSPFTVLDHMKSDMSELWKATKVTLRRGVVGFALAIIIGGVVGIAVARLRILRAGVGSMITGLQTMPSVAWVPLALILFKLSEAAIIFVIVLGAAPSIANGIIDGIDNVPPILLRAGRMLGARGFSSLRHVVIPAALPSVLSGLKQGWAFAWRSLMAAEIITNFPGGNGLGFVLKTNQDLADYIGVYEAMIMIFIVGVVIDGLFFGTAVSWMRRRYGLVDAAAR
ncbi:MAG TPA: ABC transporter permease [Acidimicrobiia bacterium]|nr:ABC transporter permease [Acidimicrobiia bacterium]